MIVGPFNYAFRQLFHSGYWVERNLVTSVLLYVAFESLLAKPYEA